MNWRSCGVGIYRKNQLIHMAPQADRVPILMQSFFDWLHQTDIHPLIKITQTAKNILKILKNDSTATITDLSAQLGVSTRTIERNLKQLQEQGLLKRLGSATKAGYWSVVSLE
ncbi:HTH domain-containing protein [Gilliamella mensalis]|uniref:HTH domain-containing protein n=1 Tax=Gilliamella mensalis TaxID=1908520 RepID=UPI001FCA3EB5|nr:DeoR family transcriptional regulator [Gilliamella mensalis]